MRDPKRLDEAREWLRYAQEDLGCAKVLGDARPQRVRHCVFWLQQSAEKSLKAYLIANSTPYPLTHDLDRLRLLCSALDPSLEPLMKACLPLTPFAAMGRYPGATDEPDPDQLTAWMSAAEALIAEVAARLAPPAV